MSETLPKIWLVSARQLRTFFVSVKLPKIWLVSESLPKRSVASVSLCLRGSVRGRSRRATMVLAAGSWQACWAIRARVSASLRR